MTNFEKIRFVIANELGIGEFEISPMSSFAELGVQSLEKVSLILELENELGIEIPDDEAERLLTVQDVIKYADSHSVTA